MENIETGLLLMIVGMTTVFAILMIVIYLGKGLIVLVNKYAPEEIIVKKQTTPQRQTAAPAAAYEPGNRRNRIGCKRYDRRKRESRQDREIIIAFIHIEYHEKRNQI